MSDHLGGISAWFFQMEGNKTVMNLNQIADQSIRSIKNTPLTAKGPGVVKKRKINEMIVSLCSKSESNLEERVSRQKFQTPPGQSVDFGSSGVLL